MDNKIVFLDAFIVIALIFVVVYLYDSISDSYYQKKYPPGTGKRIVKSGAVPYLIDPPEHCRFCRVINRYQKRDVLWNWVYYVEYEVWY